MNDFERVIYNLSDKLDTMIYAPFKEKIGAPNEPHNFGHKKEQFKGEIETEINNLRETIRSKLQKALTECCEHRCRFCLQDDEWKWDVLGADCAVASFRKVWGIEWGDKKRWDLSVFDEFDESEGLCPFCKAKVRINIGFVTMTNRGEYTGHIRPFLNPNNTLHNCPDFQNPSDSD